MASYAATVAALQRNIRAREDALPLRSEQSRSRFLLHARPTPFVYLLLHGFTAAPYQLADLGARLHAAGHNVLMPLLPGHGRAGAWSIDQPPPLPTRADSYQRFAIAWLRQARSLGHKVILGGISSGGTLAAWLSLNQSQAIARTALIAPYLSGSEDIVSLFAQRVSQDAEVWQWLTPPTAETPFYPGFSQPALQVFLDLGADLLAQTEQRPVAPTLLIASESDRAVNHTEPEQLFQQMLHYQPQCWYHREPSVLDLPQTMRTRSAINPDNPDMDQDQPDSADDLLTSLRLAMQTFIDSDLSWANLTAIAQRCQAQESNQAIINVLDELNLRDRAAADLPKFLTRLRYSRALNC
jgi:carboxylesterase